MKDYQNPEVLRKLYWDERSSLNQIARKFSVTSGTIFYFMEKFGISRGKRKPLQLPKVNFTKDLLENLYWKQRLNMNEIAENFGVSSTLVLKYMKRFGVSRRPSNEEDNYTKSFVGTVIPKETFLKFTNR